MYTHLFSKLICQWWYVDVYTATVYIYFPRICIYTDDGLLTYYWYGLHLFPLYLYIYWWWHVDVYTATVYIYFPCICINTYDGMLTYILLLPTFIFLVFIHILMMVCWRIYCYGLHLFSLYLYIYWWWYVDVYTATIYNYFSWLWVHRISSKFDTDRKSAWIPMELF